MIATYREFNLKHHDRMVTVYPGVVEAVRVIKSAGIQTGLVTSKNRQGALRGLALVGLEALMDVMVCADEVSNPKPHPEPVEKAVALLGADPARTVYVGDSIHDMHSGPSCRSQDGRGPLGALREVTSGKCRSGLLVGETGGSGRPYDRERVSGGSTRVSGGGESHRRASRTSLSLRIKVSTANGFSR